MDSDVDDTLLIEETNRENGFQMLDFENEGLRNSKVEAQSQSTKIRPS